MVVQSENNSYKRLSIAERAIGARFRKTEAEPTFFATYSRLDERIGVFCISEMKSTARVDLTCAIFSEFD